MDLKAALSIVHTPDGGRSVWKFDRANTTEYLKLKRQFAFYSAAPVIALSREQNNLYERKLRPNVFNGFYYLARQSGYSAVGRSLRNRHHDVIQTLALRLRKKKSVIR